MTHDEKLTLYRKLVEAERILDRAVEELETVAAQCELDEGQRRRPIQLEKGIREITVGLRECSSELWLRGEQVRLLFGITATE